MRVYIASNFADKDRVKARGEELAVLGIECTSRWVLETAPHNCKITDKPAQYMRETAIFDLEDIIAADKLVLTVPTASECMNMTAHQLSRGGRHFESGLMYGLILGQWLKYGRDFVEAGSAPRREVILLGEKENVFHFLNGEDEAAKYPTMVNFQTWEEVKQYLHSESLPKN